jgi:DME family drug/metabolite transporter
VLTQISAANPLSIAFFRLGIAAPILLATGWRLIGREMWAISRRDLGLMVLLGLLLAADQALYFIAISFAGVTVSTLITICCAPILVTAITAVVERKAPSRFTIILIFLALLGTLLLVAGQTANGEATASLIGVIVSIGAACGYAGVILLSRFLARTYHSLQITAVGFSVGAILLLIVSPFVGLVLAYPVMGWAVVLYLGVIPSALAYGLFMVGMRTTPAPVASVLVLLEPLTAAVLSVVFFGERLALVGLLGAVLLLGAIYALSRSESG